MDFLPFFHTRLSNEDIVGLQSIQYIFFIIVILFNEQKYQRKFDLDKVDDIIEDLVEKIKFIYNDFSIVIDLDIKDITIKFNAGKKK